MDIFWYLIGMSSGMLLGGSSSGKYSSGYEDGQEKLSDAIQKLCEERKIVLKGKDPCTGRNIEYKIGEILDQVKKAAEE
jgi:hypothetical protein